MMGALTLFHVLEAVLSGWLCWLEPHRDALGGIWLEWLCG